MDYTHLRKRTLIRKYHDSDIFNLKELKLNKSNNFIKQRIVQGSLEKTKDDIFNTLENKTSVKPLKRPTYIRNYLNTDIFNTHLDDSAKKKKSYIRVNINASSCFKGIVNNEEYKKELSNYTKAHRSKKKEYDADKYINKVSAIGRYYTELYGDEKSGIFPDYKIKSKTLINSPNKAEINTVFKNNLKNFEVRKRKLKIESNKNSEYSIDGKKKINYYKDKNNKGIFNKRKIDIYGKNLDEKNNKSLIKEKDMIKNNSKLYKQLDYSSNIFGEKNKDINTKMNNYINKQKQERENKLKLREKIKREKEELNNKINEQNKKNLCLNKNLWGGSHCRWQKSNMDWTDTGAQVLFKTESNLNNKNELSAFQRKLYYFADSDNMDTLSELKNKLDIGKYKVKKVINDDDNNIEQTKEILNTMPNNNLRTDQKIAIISHSTTSRFLNNSTNENLSKMCKRINDNIRSVRQSKSKKKSSNIIKIMGKNSKENDKNAFNNINNKKINEDYLLEYSTKSTNNFDNANQSEIKKIFREKGIHIFDVKRDEFGIGKTNKIKFKIREGEENNKNELEHKIKMIEINLNKNKYKVSIKKDNKNNKRMIKNNTQTSINNSNDKIKYNYNGKKNLISQFPIVDFKYKNINSKK